MENKNLIIFTQCIQKLFGPHGEVKEIPSTDPSLPPLYFFVFLNSPDQKLMTVISYGLSESNHEKWHAGRPELILCVDSQDESWVNSLGLIINAFRGEKAFSYGSVYELDKALSQKSKMTAFTLFTPSFLSVEERSFQLSGKIVYLAQAYPIYKGEAQMIQKQGFASFWENEAFEDPYWTKRPDVSKLKP